VRSSTAEAREGWLLQVAAEAHTDVKKMPPRRT